MNCYCMSQLLLVVAADAVLHVAVTGTGLMHD
jgi:hypothetical protein